MKITLSNQMELDVMDNDLYCGTKNLTQLCRICLATNNDSEHTSIYNYIKQTSTKSYVLIYEILCKVIGIKICCDNEFPSYICSTCLQYLNIAFKFQAQYEQTEKYLNECFGKYRTNTANNEILVQENGKQNNNCSVEIISKKGIYDLKDLVIIEDYKEDLPSYEGFLQNLGTEISAKIIKIGEHNECKQVKSYCDEVILQIKGDNLGNGHDNSISTCTVGNTKPTKTVVSETNKKDCVLSCECLLCKKKFTSEYAVKRHIIDMHASSNKYLCQLCGHIAKRKSSLQNHIISKHNDRKFSCEYCGKRYLYHHNLTQHVKAVHQNQRDYLCTICGKRFNYGNALQYHMRLHTGEKKYVCSYCSKTFNMQCGLKRHMRTHTGLRPYKCAYCEKSFSSSGEVKCHEMLHTGYRPYHCKVCGKGFTKSHNMKLHVMGHSGSFSCETCPKTFIDEFCLKRHKQSVHGVTNITI